MFQKVPEGSRKFQKVPEGPIKSKSQGHIVMQGTFHAVPLACMQLRVEIGMHKDGTLQYDFNRSLCIFSIFSNLFCSHSVPLPCMQFN